MSDAKDEMNWIEMRLLVSYDKRHVSYQIPSQTYKLLINERWWYDLSRAKDKKNGIEMILIVSHDKRCSVSYQTESDLRAVE